VTAATTEASPSIGKRALRAFEWMLEATGALFGIVVGVLILLMSVDIGIRYFKIGTLPWLIEVVEYLVCAGTFLAAPWVLRQGAHVRVDIVVTALPKRIAQRLEQFIDVIGFGISAVLFYYGCKAVLQSANANQILYKTWWTPEWIVLLPVPVACFLLCVEFVLRIFRVEGVIPENLDPSQRASI
jgi:TRAP-type C4-dicarboxylate transport system permease small subunit